MHHTGERSGIGRPAAHELCNIRSHALPMVLICLCAALTGCSRQTKGPHEIAAPAILHLVDLTTPANPIVVEGPAILSSARNESLDVVVQADATALQQHRWLRIAPARSASNSIRIAVAA